jgi:PIN domain nuclease of toxin-antitoxin system
VKLAYLIDSHALLWAAGQPNRISSKVRRVLVDEESLVFVSIASLWEISIKQNLGKLTVPADFFLSLFDGGYELMPISLKHLEVYRELPLHHRDPFDRILVAQAQHEQLTLITHDTAFDAYQIPILKV